MTNQSGEAVDSSTLEVALGRAIRLALLCGSTLALSGCFYFPSIPTARMLAPGQPNVTSLGLGTTVYSVLDRTNASSEFGQQASSQGYGYYQTFLPSGFKRYATASPRWNWGWGMDLAYPAAIGELKYQWKAPLRPKDWMSALVAQATAGESLEVNLADVVTLPLGRGWDLNAGFRLGATRASQTFVPADHPMTPGSGILTVPENGYPWPGTNFTFADYFLGCAWRDLSGGLTVRCLLNQPYGGSSVENGPLPFPVTDTYRDGYAPIVNASLSYSFGGQARP